ncbi:MAG: pimeloyl-ACP methyl ester carboxylesterase, partial [Paracoccaceae bacterium]
MPVIRINAVGDQPSLHDSTRPVSAEMDRYADETGPVIAMIHGFKYRPGDPVHCPHRTILSRRPADRDRKSTPWLRQLRFGMGHANEGLAIAFGWQAQSVLWQAQKQTARAGRALAQVLGQLHHQNPTRPIHLIGHSLGADLALEALHHLPPGAVNRIISMTGASYQSRAAAALATPAGRRAEFINVTSRENDPFDFLFERLISPPQRGDRVIGHGLDMPNAVTVQLDCRETLSHLRHLGVPVHQP